MDTLYKLYLKSTGICTDSRRIRPGCIFFALKGEHFNGNRYAKEALARGASLAVVDEPELADLKGSQVYSVADVLTTLQQLAHHHRRQFDLPVLAVTGTNGKTTTKELLAAVLGRRFALHYTPGNWNNHIGLPLTLLDMPAETNFLLLEMGANHEGEIKALCQIAEPTHGLITNVGMAHLEGFGSFERLRKAKAELYHHLAEKKGLAFLNLDEPYLQEMLPESLRRFTYSSQYAQADCRVEAVQTQGTIRLAFEQTGQRFTAHLQLSGRYNFQNAMTAVAVGLYFEVPPEDIVFALEHYRPAMNRSQWVEKEGYRYFLDAYNANPTSMRLALEDFANREAPVKIAILGEMFELGSYAEKAHAELLDYALQLPLDSVLCVGSGFRQTAEERDVPYFEDVRVLQSWLKAHPFPKGAHVFLKASRAVALERLLEAP